MRGRARPPLPDPAQCRRRPRRASCRPSSSRACRSRPTGRRPAQGWIHEIKHDGYRIAGAHRRPRGPAAHPQGARLDRALSGIADALQKLAAQLRADRRRDRRRGRRRHPELQRAAVGPQRGPQDRFRYFLFDLLYLRRRSISARPRCWSARRCCSRSPRACRPARRFASASTSTQDGPTMLEHACRLGLEGIVSKRIDLPYRLRPRRALAEVQVHAAAGVRHPRLPALDRRARARSARWCWATTTRAS